MLITLGIIGIVAAMTIPNLIAEYQKEVWANQLKKVYSTLANSAISAAVDNGPMTSWTVYNTNETVPGTSMKGGEYFAKTYMIPYLSVSKILGTTSLNYTVKQLNGDICTTYFSGLYKFILNDGSLIMVNANYTSNNTEIYIDTNGEKPPNTWGKDIHEFVYFGSGSGSYSGKLYPWENHGSTKSLINSTTYGCNKNATARNEYCDIIIMRNGWKIPNKDEYVKMGGTADEYPW